MRPSLLAVLLLCALVLPWPGSETAAAPAASYYPIQIEDDGQVRPGAVTALVQAVRPEAGRAGSQIVMLVHGFNTSTASGREQYGQIARVLREEGELHGLPMVPVGVHWQSRPGPLINWLPRMIGYRITSELGFPHAIPNPYFQKVRLAQLSGLYGMRSALLSLQAAFPGVPIHVMAHSLGSEVTVRALAPESVPTGGAGPGPQPYAEGALALGIVTLAGADLDHDVFTRRSAQPARPALSCARAWWITVPRQNRADAVLELRRGAGRRDALGNQGLSLHRDDFTLLMERCGLVIDDEAIPIAHEITDYYNQERLHRLVLSMAYLREPEAAAGEESTLALLARLRRVNPEELFRFEADRRMAVRLYARWRLEPKARDLGAVRVREPGGSQPPS